VQELAKRVLPLCENYIVVSQFTEARSHFKHGLVNHAFAAALRAILQDYHAMVAQLEHQFRLTRLSLQGLWFFSQPMIAAMQALSMCVLKASTQNASGAAILNLLHNQVTLYAYHIAIK
jgi:gamma-tubulin complex component 2